MLSPVANSSSLESFHPFQGFGHCYKTVMRLICVLRKAEISVEQTLKRFNVERRLAPEKNLRRKLCS